MVYTLSLALVTIEENKMAIDNKMFSMADDGALEINVWEYNNQRIESFEEKYEFGLLEIISREGIKLGDWKSHDKILKEYNDREYLRINAALKDLKQKSVELPSSVELKKMIRFHEDVLAHFIDWYKTFDVKEPVIPGSSLNKNNTPLTETKTGNKRLILSPNENEKLNEKIVNEVRDFIDAGKGSQEQAFNQLSLISKKIFGRELSKSVIEGRFKRNKKDVDR